MNAAKSSAEGTELPKTYTVEITEAGGGKMHDKVLWVGSDGTRLEMEYTAAADGKAAPMTGDPDIDSVIVTQKSARTTYIRFMKGGKQVEWGHYTVSADGHSMRATEGGTENGKKYRYHFVFERQ